MIMGLRGLRGPDNPQRRDALGHDQGMDSSRRPVLLRQVIGRALRRARESQGRTVREVAAAATVSAAHLSELERGHNEASSEVLAAVCAALHLSLADVLADARSQLTTLSVATTHRVPEPRVPDRHQGYVSLAHRRPRSTVRRAHVPIGCGTRPTTWSMNPYARASSAVNQRSRSASATIRS